MAQARVIGENRKSRRVIVSREESVCVVVAAAGERDRESSIIRKYDKRTAPPTMGPAGKREKFGR